MELLNNKTLVDIPENASRPVIKAMLILEQLLAADTALRLTDISKLCGIPKATALRYLAAFEHMGYVNREPVTNTYTLGIKVVSLAQKFYVKERFLSIAKSFLAQLAEESGETAHLAVLDGIEVIYVDIVASRQPVQAVVRRGDRASAYCVASGRAMLAHAKPEVIDAVVTQGLVPRTSRTVSSEKALRALLNKGIKDGYFLSSGEFVEDVVGVSAALHSPDGNVFAAIGVSFPVSRIGQKDIDSVGQLVKRFAGDISVRFEN